MLYNDLNVSAELLQELTRRSSAANERGAWIFVEKRFGTLKGVAGGTRSPFSDFFRAAKFALAAWLENQLLYAPIQQFTNEEHIF